MKQKTHRCFVALDLPSSIRRSAIQAQETLRITCPELRYTRPENLHLTLKFLGEIPLETCTECERRLQGIRMESFQVHLSHAGFFSPRIAWIALVGAEEMQQRVDEALADLFSPEHRFMGHVTIARSKRLSRQHLAALEGLQVPETRAEVQTVSLVESHLSAEGPRYETLANFELLASANGSG